MDKIFTNFAKKISLISNVENVKILFRRFLIAEISSHKIFGPASYAASLHVKDENSDQLRRNKVKNWILDVYFRHCLA